MHMYVAEWIHVPQWCYTFFSCAFLTTLHGGTDAGGCLLPTLCLGAFSTTFFWFFSGTFFWIFSGWFFWIFSGWFFWTFPGWFFAGNFSGLLTAGSSRNSGLVSIERRIVEHSVWYNQWDVPVVEQAFLTTSSNTIGHWDGRSSAAGCWKGTKLIYNGIVGLSLETAPFVLPPSPVPEHQWRWVRYQSVYEFRKPWN